MTSRILIILAVLALAACSGAPASEETPPEPLVIDPALYPNETPEIRLLVNKWADHYDVPRALVHKVI